MFHCLAGASCSFASRGLPPHAMQSSQRARQFLDQGRADISLGLFSTGSILQRTSFSCFWGKVAVSSTTTGVSLQCTGSLICLALHGQTVAPNICSSCPSNRAYKTPLKRALTVVLACCKPIPGDPEVDRLSLVLCGWQSIASQAWHAINRMWYAKFCITDGIAQQVQTLQLSTGGWFSLGLP